MELGAGDGRVRVVVDERRSFWMKESGKLSSRLRNQKLNERKALKLLVTKGWLYLNTVEWKFQSFCGALVKLHALGGFLNFKRQKAFKA